MKKQKIIEKILEILQAGAETTADLIDIMTSGYHESYRKVRRSITHGPRQFRSDWAAEYREAQHFYSLLNYLKRQGFIEKQKPGHRTAWKITQDGLRKFLHLKRKNRTRKSIAQYQSRRDDKLRIVIFDVPEKERQKRIWIRSALLSLGFSLLQRSVWIGKQKIPKEFIEDLREKKMLPYVHIFEVSQTGTLKEIR